MMNGLGIIQGYIVFEPLNPTEIGCHIPPGEIPPDKREEMITLIKNYFEKKQISYTMKIGPDLTLLTDYTLSFEIFQKRL